MSLEGYEQRRVPLACRQCQASLDPPTHSILDNFNRLTQRTPAAIPEECEGRDCSPSPVDRQSRNAQLDAVRIGKRRLQIGELRFEQCDQLIIRDIPCCDPKQLRGQTGDKVRIQEVAVLTCHHAIGDFRDLIDLGVRRAISSGQLKRVQRILPQGVQPVGKPFGKLSINQPLHAIALPALFTSLNRAAYCRQARMSSGSRSG